MKSFTAVVLCALLAAGCSSKARKARHMERADEYFKNGDYESATIEYINVLRIDPKDIHAYRRLAQGYWERAMYREAFPVLARTRDLDPNDVDLRLKLSALYKAGGLHEKARAEALAVLEKESCNIDAFVALVDSSVGADELADAMARLQSKSELLADKARYNIALGMVHLRQGELDAAEKAFREGEKIDPDSSEVHQVLALLHQVRRDPEKAAEEFEKSGRLAPVVSPARVRWALSELTQGDREAAKEILQEIVAEESDYAAARLQLASIALSEKDYEGCRAHLARVPEQSSPSMAVLLVKADLLLAEGKVDESVKELERGARLFPRTPRVHHALALASIRQGNIQRAIQALKRTANLAPRHVGTILLLAGLQIRTGDPEPAVESLKSLVREAPKFGRALTLLAAGYRAMGKHDEAIETYGKLAELTPDDPRPLHLQGNVLAVSGRLQEAREMFEAVLKAEPEFIPSLEQLVRMDLAQGKKDDALKRVTDALARRQDNAMLLFLKGYVCQSREEFDSAEEAYLKAIDLKPEYLKPYTALSGMYAKAGKNEEAIEKAEQALALNPGNPGTMMLAAMLYERQDDTAKAIETYEKLIKRFPRFAVAANNLACLYMAKEGGMDRALECAKTAHEVAPQNPYITDTLGWIAYQRGDYKWALSLLAEAAGKAPQHAEILCHLGMAQCAVGKEAGGRAAIEKALSMDADFPCAEDAKGLLAILRIDPTKAGDEKTLNELVATLEKNPTHVTALHRAAAICENTGKRDESLGYYRKAIAASPEFVPAVKGVVRLLLPHKEKAQEAVEAAKRARELDPDDAEADLLLAKALLQTGDRKWALSLLNEAARRMPGNTEVRFRLAWVYYTCGDVPRALREARVALSATGQVSEARQFVELVTMYDSAAGLEEVPTAVREALDRDGDYLPARMIVAAVNRSKGDNAGAIAIYEQALEQYPSFAPAAAALATLYLDVPKKTDRAFELATAAYRQLRDDATITRTLGILAYRRGDYRYASRMLEQTARKSPQDAESLYCLGLSQHRLKRLDAAKRNLNKALELDSESPLAEEAKKKLLDLNLDGESPEAIQSMLKKYGGGSGGRNPE